MQRAKEFHGKILLFGEYALLSSSMALGLPFNKFSARLAFPDSFISKSQSFSNLSLLKFFSYLKTTNLRLNYPEMERDIRHGLYFASNIKNAYGMGSSGALVAAVYSRYCLSMGEDLVSLKKMFSTMESFFHGNSSGIDPLICYNDKPTLFISQDKITSINIPNNELKVFLIDSKRTSQTAPLIAGFLKKMENDCFSAKFESEFVAATNRSINAFISGNSEVLFPSVKNVSEFTLSNLREMVPENVFNVWEQGLITGDYYLKLCGSGGGGYVLGFTRDFYKAKQMLSVFEITEL